MLNRGYQLHDSLMKIARHFAFCLLILIAPGSPYLLGGERLMSGQDAGLVLGASSFTERVSGDEADELGQCRGIVIDPVSGKVFVADSGNHRVLRYSAFEDLVSGAGAEMVFGQSEFGTGSDDISSTKMDTPVGLAIGSEGELWVADSENHRVLRFDAAATALSGTAASLVLGQVDFDSNSRGLSAKGMDTPEDLAISPDGDLYVAGPEFHRILIFEDANDKTNGASADRVLGQPDFTSGSSGNDNASFEFPRAIALADDGTLYVADDQNNRIMVFEDVANLATGSAADRQIGQSDFGTSDSGSGQSEFHAPLGLAIDQEGTLFVCDSRNARVVGFHDPENASGEVDADIVLGQPDFSTYDAATTASGCEYPVAVATDSEGRVWVADFLITRVHAYEKRVFQPDLTVGETRGSQKGNGVYNRSGSGQKKTFKTKMKEVKVFSSIGNDGDFPDSYSIRMKKATSRFKVKCYSLASGKTNVTAKAEAGTHETGEIEAGSKVYYRLDVKPKGSYRSRRGTFNGWLRATSSVDGEIDYIRAKVKNRP